MNTFESMVKILKTYAGKPLSPRYPTLGNGKIAEPSHRLAKKM